MAGERWDRKKKDGRRALTPPVRLPALAVDKLSGYDGNIP
jgi:hypothetical protein